jgi:lysophospholipase L1-like esterase
MATRGQITRRSLLAGGLAAAVAGAVIGADALAPDTHEVPGEAAGPGPTLAPTADRPAPRTSVVMVGDSITAGSATPLQTALTTAGFSNITIEAQPSRRIAVGGGPSEPRSGEQAIDTLLDKGTSPDVWVVALGTNDVGKYADLDAYASLIDGLLAMLPAKPLLWVDVYRREYLDHTKMFNGALRQRIAARGNASVVSWYALASKQSEKILQTDRIHPNAAGTKVFADLVAGGVEVL